MKKLRETLVAVQQLEKKMSSLRAWLAHIEMELSRPIVYDTCDEKEIEKKLSQQQVNGSQITPQFHIHMSICNVHYLTIQVPTDLIKQMHFVCLSVYANYNSAV